MFPCQVRYVAQLFPIKIWESNNALGFLLRLDRPHWVQEGKTPSRQNRQYAMFSERVYRCVSSQFHPVPSSETLGLADASDFLRKNPFPGRAIAETYADDPHRHKTKAKRFLNILRICCGRTGDEDDFYDEEHEHEHRLFDVSEGLGNRPFYWTTSLQDSFREELEKWDILLRWTVPIISCLFRLVILDYLMLNTDRGLDNFMIKCCDIDHEKAPIDVPPVNAPRLDTLQMSEIHKPNPATSGVVVPPTATPSMSALGTKTPGTSTPSRRQSHIHIAAIDNSLSFPHEHPRGWRSFTYGWLYLPVSIIGRPFSERTRNHFLPLLTSKSWWEETSWQLRQLFALDPDFHPKMFGVCFHLDRKVVTSFLMVAGLETTRCYQGTGMEYRSIVEACGKLFLVCHP